MIKKDERKLVIKYLEDSLLPNIDLTLSRSFKATGLKIIDSEGVGIMLCPYCSCEMDYFSKTTATKCNLCGSISISEMIADNAKSIFTIKNLALEASVSFDFKYFQTTPTLTLGVIKDFLNAQLPRHFINGLKSAGWTTEEISKSFIGSVGEDSEHMWERFIGHEEMDVYQKFCLYKGYFYMPFYDGDRINAVLLPPDFKQNDVWGSIGYKFLYKPKFHKVWYKKPTSKKIENTIAVSNPLYAIYLLAQGKPATFVYGNNITLDSKEAERTFVFESDLTSRDIFNQKAQVIKSKKANENNTIWDILKEVDVNSLDINWISEIERYLKNGESLYDAVNLYQNSKKMRILVRPV